jgi:hypothetical protein|tara:strand:- start:475 stop:690 length:216 start_codon:yes stop_codon:yes gene_type:complete
VAAAHMIRSQQQMVGARIRLPLVLLWMEVVHVYQKMIVDTIVDGIAPLAIALEVFTKLMGLLVTRNLLVYV